MKSTTVNSLLAYGIPFIVAVGVYTLLRRHGLGIVRTVVFSIGVYVVVFIAVLITLGATGRL